MRSIAESTPGKEPWHGHDHVARFVHFPLLRFCQPSPSSGTCSREFRYAARLASVAGARLPVRSSWASRSCWYQKASVGPKTRISNSGAQPVRAKRRPLGTPPIDCIGLYCLARNPRRIFHYEVNIIHDFCALVFPMAFPPDLRDGFVKFLTEHILESDLLLADSHATKADARVVLARGCRADLGRTPRPQPLRRNSLASRSRRALQTGSVWWSRRSSPGRMPASF